ncbi:unnamed protein product [Rodentolepis nana]|uniref:Ribosome biogenesis protein RPF2 homolog n=1 Tax=Rodentolepis nana TaxID=102285 RepID=A0A0R3TH19_RODNA|nr:unnamed protein product [Rodentolepis nana]
MSQSVKEKKVSKGKGSTESGLRKPKRAEKNINIQVLGSPEAVDLFLCDGDILNCQTMDYSVNIMATAPLYPSDESDMIICVYDVCNYKTVEYLRNEIFSKYFKLKNLVIVGVGLEGRSLENLNNVTPKTICQQLCHQFRCIGTEVVSCGAKSKAMSLLSLYGSLCPEEFSAQNESGGVSNGKKSKAKANKI